MKSINFSSVSRTRCEVGVLRENMELEHVDWHFPVVFSYSDSLNLWSIPLQKTLQWLWLEAKHYLKLHKAQNSLMKTKYVQIGGNKAEYETSFSILLIYSNLTFFFLCLILSPKNKTKIHLSQDRGQ